MLSRPPAGRRVGDRPGGDAPGEPPPVVVSVSNEQDDVDLGDDGGARWAGLVEAVLGDCAIDGPGEASVSFVDADAIAELNVAHMGHEGPTDVLSFPIDADDVLDAGDERMVGDIVICPAVAAANAPDHAGTLDDELALLLVHATLHLLGHDHAVDDERATMWARERELLARHWRPFTRDPWGP